MKKNPEIAKTILAQLGGARFIAMSGAKNLVDLGDGLRFDLPRNFAKGGINKVAISLSPEDLYILACYKWNARALECPIVSKAEGIFAEDLCEFFTAATGLDTKL